MAIKSINSHRLCMFALLAHPIIPMYFIRSELVEVFFLRVLSPQTNQISDTIAHFSSSEVF